MMRKLASYQMKQLEQLVSSVSSSSSDSGGVNTTKDVDDSSSCASKQFFNDLISPGRPKEDDNY